MVHECPSHRYNVDYSIMNLFLSNVKKSIEISKKYCDTLSDLSLEFSNNPGNYFYVGFFDKQLLANKSQKHNTIRDSKKKKTVSKNEKHKK